MKRVRLNSRVKRAFQGRSRGFTLIEVVIAMLLLGIIGVAVLSALSYASTVLIVTDRRATAESLARSQMEYVKDNNSYPYDFEEPQSYEQSYVESPIHPGYFISVSAQALHNPDDGIQLITVTIDYSVLRYNISTRGSELVQKQFTLEDYKRNPVT